MKGKGTEMPRELAGAVVAAFRESDELLLESTRCLRRGDVAGAEHAERWARTTSEIAMRIVAVDVELLGEGAAA